MTARRATDRRTIADALAALHDLHRRALANGPGLAEQAACRVCGGTGAHPGGIAHRLMHQDGEAHMCVVVRARELLPRLAVGEG